MDFGEIIERMKSAGVRFDKGLTDFEIDRIENLYESPHRCSAFTRKYFL